MEYDRKTDQFRGHDYPGVLGGGPGFIRFELDQIEMGARAALALNDPEQTWWETIGRDLLARESLASREDQAPATDQ